MNNEISTLYAKVIAEHDMDVDKVLKESHCKNATERGIQTAKTHFKAILAGCDQKFLLHLWDRLLPQAKLTYNLLSPFNANSNVLAYQ